VFIDIAATITSVALTVVTLPEFTVVTAVKDSAVPVPSRVVVSRPFHSETLAPLPFVPAALIVMVIAVPPAETGPPYQISATHPAPVKEVFPRTHVTPPPVMEEIVWGAPLFP
jgi:hypothetical protein